MQIGITETLRKFLKFYPFPPWDCYDEAFALMEEDLFYCWEGNRVTAGGHDLLVLQNAYTRFACVREMTKADWDEFEKEGGLSDLIAACLKICGFTQEAVDTYLLYAGPILIGKTHSGKARSALTALVKTVKGSEVGEISDHIPHELVYTLNINFPTSSKSSSLRDGIPKETMCSAFVHHRIDDPLGNGHWHVSGPEPSLDPFGKLAYASLTSEANHRQAELKKPEIDYERCALCGAEAYVVHEGQPLCLDCHREMGEGQQGQPHAIGNGTASGDELFVEDTDGNVRRFRVEHTRNVFGHVWEAIEVVEDDDPRRALGFEGLRTAIEADYGQEFPDPYLTLRNKVEKALKHPSLAPDPDSYYAWEVLPTDAANDPLVAREEGWGEISVGEEDYEWWIVIDGRAFTGHEFLQLMRDYEGSVLRWEIVPRTGEIFATDAPTDDEP